MVIPTEMRLSTSILDHLPALVCTLSSDEQLQYLNAACQQLLGGERHEWVGRAFATIMHPDDRAAVHAACRRARAQAEAVGVECRCLDANGSAVGVQWSVVWVPAEALLLCLGRTIAAPRQAGQHAHTPEAYYRAVTEHGFDMTGLLSEEGLYLYVAGSILARLGYQPGELIGRSAFDFIHPDDLPAVQARWVELSQEPSFTVADFRFRSANGEWRWMETSIGNQLHNPDIRAYTAISRDVTEQRQAARRLHEQKEFYQAVAEHGFDIMSLMNADGVYTYVGGSVQKALGYLPEQLLGHSPFEFIHPEDVAAAQAAWADAGTQAIFTVPQCRFRTAGGAWRWMETTVGNQLSNPAIQAFTLCSRDVTDQKIHAFELAASEQRFRLLFEHNLAPAAFQDVDGTVLDINAAYLRFLNMSREQVLHRQLTDVLPASLASSAEAHFRRALNGQPVTYQANVVYEGIERTLTVTNIPLVVEGRLVGVYSTGKDITQIAAAERLLMEQDARLHRVLESITAAFLSIDKNWNLTYLNREGERLLNLSYEEAVGSNIWELFPEDANSLYYQKYKEALDTGQMVQFEIFSRHQKRWLELKVYPYVEGISVFFSDITKRVESDKQLKLMALVAEGTVNSVVITDAAGRVEWVNPGFVRDTGYTLADMLGKKPGEVLQGPETDPAAVRRFHERLQEPKPFSVTILNYKKSGQKLWFAIDVTPIFNDAGELTQFIAIQQNINFRKEVEASQAKMTEELYRHNRDLQQFTYVISHNLRAPLANAMGLASLLTKVDHQSPVFDTSLAHLRASIGQADTVLKDLNLVLSIRDKQDVQTPERVNLAAVCRQAVSNLDEALQQCGGTVQIDVPDDMTVRGVRAYLYSIFYNLLSNSIKYRAEGRALLVEIACSYHSKGGLSISFTDNGSGFDMFKAGSDVFQLYKRFHTNQQGRGIGLFLVKTHVEALGGKIEVTSGVDYGTRFLIQLAAH